MGCSSCGQRYGSLGPLQQVAGRPVNFIRRAVEAPVPSPVNQALQKSMPTAAIQTSVSAPTVVVATVTPINDPLFDKDEAEFQ